MPERRLIDRVSRETPAELRASGRRRARPLPEDLLRQASQRLQIMALVGSALWIVGTVLGHVAYHSSHPDDPSWSTVQVPDLVAVASATLGLALLAWLRLRPPDPAAVPTIGLMYMVATTFAIGVMIHWGRRLTGPIDVDAQITWVGPVILMFAAIIPAPPWNMFVAGLLAASMDSIGMLIWHAAGRYEYGPLRNVVLMHYPNYLLLGVAVVISHVVTRLGQEVTRERELGSYRLGELLGRGGMGEVYRATHRMLARPAAIKLIRPEVLAAGDGASVQLAVSRFRREAEVAATLRSPHTVELYDFGVTQDETLYFVMELLDGMDLDTLVRRHGAVEGARVVHILVQVCESLAEAHAAGLVHRDIKPANIHLGRLGLREDWVKVLDFGLVKSVAAGDGTDSLGTAAGITPGTPAYMAPEMALHETVDGRADLYALGCVAYFLLTGRQVFEAATAFQMIAKHLHEAPIPPSFHAPAPIAPALERLVLACLAKAPEDRPAAAAELGRQLQALAIEPWTQEQARRWWAERGAENPASESQQASAATSGN